MQYNCVDYYEEIPYGRGCCLNCEESEPGCLCKECKCRKCYWYEFMPTLGRGVCELPDFLKEERERKFREKQEEQKRKYPMNLTKGTCDYTRIGLKKEQTQLGDFK